MKRRPYAALAMDPRVASDVFPANLLDQLGKVVDLREGTVVTEFAAATRDVEILITGWGCPLIDARALGTMPELRAVIHAAGSVKGHVSPSVFERGVVVSSAASVNAEPVAEYTIAMLVLAAKRTFQLAAAYASGDTAPRYAAREDSGLSDVTVGVIGASRIGRRVIARLSDHHVQTIVADPYLTSSEAAGLGVEQTDLDDLCRRADLITVHAPALPETWHLLGASQLAAMRDGAVVINTARGCLIDTHALVKECASGRLSAILDVTEPEPLPAGHPLFTMPTVLVTPHLAGARGREVRRLGEFAVREVERLVSGQTLRGLVRQGDLARIA